SVSDIKTVTGTWKGLVYLTSQSTPDYVTLTIREDGSYDVVSAQQPIGTSRGRGKIVISEGGLIFEGERGRGVGRLLRNPDGSLMMVVDATLSDTSTRSAKLSRSNWRAERSARSVTLDVETGRELWNAELPASAPATPRWARRWATGRLHATVTA